MAKLLLLLLTLLTSGFPGTGGAQDAATPPPENSPQSPVFAIQSNPSTPDGYFAVTLEPGATASLVAQVVTLNSIPLTLRAYATNAISLANGGFGAGLDTDEVIPPATWISFPAQTFDLGSTDFLDIPFTVTAPADAPPGQYVAALIAQTDEPLEVEGGSFLNQIIRSSIPVMVTVPGPVTPSFTIGTPIVNQDGMVSIPITNTGNVLVRPAGAVSLTWPGESGSAPIAVAMGSVFAGTTTTIELPLPANIPPGSTIELTSTLTDPETQASASIGPVSIAVSVAPAEPPSTFSVDAVTVTAFGDPVQYATIAITIDNQGENIISGLVSLKVYRDDTLVETYVVARNQTMPNGASTIETRYVPASGWQSGTYRFEIEISSVDAGGAATVIHAGPVPDTIVIP